MPNPTPIPLGAPTWIDLATSDFDRAVDFYGRVFGWTFSSPGPDYGGYVNASKDGRLVAGLMPNDPQWQMPDGWSTYFHTAGIEATIAAAIAAGGTSCGGAMEIPEKGSMAMLTDPSNAMFGLWQPTGHRGFEVVGEAGAPVWHQLTTRDYAKALDFYRAVFGWDTQVEADTDDFRYTTAIFGGEQLLGVMDGSVLPDGVVSQWITFLGAEDVDKTIEVVTANGGSVIRAAEDTPYGRLAAVADPTGAGFNLASL
jgi:predicted enzyme related to lactoylglutathione lyase